MGYYKVDGDRVVSFSAGEKKGFVPMDLPKGFKRGDDWLSQLRTDGKTLRLATEAELAPELEAKAKAAKVAEFKDKAGATPELFEVIMTLEKVIQGKVTTASEKDLVTNYVNAHKTLYEATK